MNPKIKVVKVLQVIKLLALAPLIVACSYPPSTVETVLPKITPTPFIRQPIPVEPRIGGTFSGLLNSNDLVTIHISDKSGHEVLYGTHPGNGPWEVVIANLVANKYYVVTVEANGYTSQPISYTINLEAPNQISPGSLELNFSFNPDDP